MVFSPLLEVFSLGKLHCNITFIYYSPPELQRYYFYVIIPINKPIDPPYGISNGVIDIAVTSVMRNII